MTEEEYFLQINNAINRLSKEDKENLNEYLSDMEFDFNGGTKIREYEKYIKKNYKQILYKTFRKRNVKELAYICKYIFDLEWYNEWAYNTFGQHSKTFFGWFS